MILQVHNTYEQLCEAVADTITTQIKRKPDAFICLASGHTPRGVYQILANRIASKILDIQRCTFFSLDEWLGVPLSHKGSCYQMLKDDFFDPAGIAYFEFFNTTAPDLGAECARMNDKVSQHGGFDVMLLGVGLNGHLGMNEPGTSFDTNAHVSDLAIETITSGQKYFDAPATLSRGITFGIRHIMESKLPIVMANGKAKASIVAAALSGKVTSQIPMSVVQQIEQAHVMLDGEAAEMMPRNAR